MVFDAIDTSVTSPLPLNTQPGAGTNSTAFFLGDGLTAVSGCCAVMVGIQVSVQIISLVSSPSGEGGKPPRPVIIHCQLADK